MPSGDNLGRWSLGRRCSRRLIAQIGADSADISGHTIEWLHNARDTEGLKLSLSEGDPSLLRLTNEIFGVQRFQLTKYQVAIKQVERPS